MLQSTAPCSAASDPVCGRVCCCGCYLGQQRHLHTVGSVTLSMGKFLNARPDTGTGKVQCVQVRYHSGSSYRLCLLATVALRCCEQKTNVEPSCQSSKHCTARPFSAQSQFFSTCDLISCGHQVLLAGAVLQVPSWLAQVHALKCNPWAAQLAGRWQCL